MALISKIPAEIWLSIFEHVHVERQQLLSLALGDRLGEPMEEMTARLATSLHDLQPFPYAQAAVCAQWRDVLKISPKFWTDVVLYTNQAYCGLDPEEILEFSDDLPIRIFITYDQMASTRALDNVEGDAVRRMLDVCRPHFKRCIWMRVDTVVYHSLPTLGYDLEGDLSVLKSLSFSTSFFTHQTPQARDRMTIRMPCGLPVLTHLHIDGVTFLEATNRPFVWQHWADHVEGLVIDFFRSTSATGSLDPSRVFRNVSGLGRLRTLSLRHLEFDVVESSGVPDVDDHCTLDTLERLVLDYIPSDATEWIFQAVFMPNLGNLKMSGGRWDEGVEIPFAGSMQLDRYDPNDAPMDMTWSGLTLFISQSPEVDEDFLEQLSEQRDGPGSERGCHNVGTLVFSNCPLVTVQGLKNLVEKRGEGIDYSNMDWFRESWSQPALHTLVVTAAPGAVPPTEEEWDWFESRLAMFIWKPSTCVHRH